MFGGNQHHDVVFDVNVYMDVAALLGAPFSWAKFNAAAAAAANDAVPHPTNAAVDSLRAIAMCQSGKFAGRETLSVHTNTHIDATLKYKAQQDARPDPTTGYYGLGWSHDDAHALVEDLVGGIVSFSDGTSLGGTLADGTPPLDHEDGMVFGACRHLSGADPLAETYCVTRDQGFIDAVKNGALVTPVHVIHPQKFVQLLRHARVSYSIPRPPLP